MLSLFPQLLFLAPLSADLLRIAAGIVFLLLAWTHWQKREELSHIDFFVVGKGAWIPIFASVFELIIGVGLILGVYAQAIALLGALAALKSFVWKRRYSGLFPLSRIESALLFVICLSLVMTGAGIFALDMPL
ncbi:hypothetical protein A2704_06605 [Candidatus Kaiserbacteria bacterium RIFCSPHIGHO2_01_FULL_54_36b]|uniref:DoxX family protein n=1 Tax=Candidatus Kaiserbacteria bacterium RIFCSPHIGHO2_01_FULL_54_36b TaxID=1798483 RepID=A0A1F6CHZ7_9BACT|nr:MAG: hypothetical protein A2704_06605 [Candidatus Kaiserbacteria bacterium RIFCSPHIGHO2_01_FULL_54_36b]